jgi:hypothetical protein
VRTTAGLQPATIEVSRDGFAFCATTICSEHVIPSLRAVFADRNQKLNYSDNSFCPYEWRFLFLFHPPSFVNLFAGSSAALRLVEQFFFVFP